MVPVDNFLTEGGDLLEARGLLFSDDSSFSAALRPPLDPFLGRCVPGFHMSRFKRERGGGEKETCCRVQEGMLNDDNHNFRNRNSLIFGFWVGETRSGTEGQTNVRPNI